VPDPKPSLFTLHDRVWAQNRFVYPVISRRSRGLSIGINLNPDKRCNFDCVYCSVDRSDKPERTAVDVEVLGAELTQLLDAVRSGAFWQIDPFDRTPPALRRLNDVAFSGDGEPTSCAQLEPAARAVAQALKRAAFDETRIVLITNATLLHQPRVKQALQYLDAHRGEVWAKLDAGTEAYYRSIERTNVPFDRVLGNILDTGRAREIVIQSLFLMLDGAGPDDAEIDAYIGRLATLRDGGCRIRLVQVYTVARHTAIASVTPLSSARLDQIAAGVRSIGLAAEAYYAPAD
jgi:wyosine [tRNA(Phe)-imidazoG37] synthetase (radical SAM superfamily)